MCLFSWRVLSVALGTVALFTGPASAANPPTINVMTINMEHRDRPHELRVAADFMRDHLERVPDFILCQEVKFERDDELAPNTAAVLARELGFDCKGTRRKSDNEGVAIISRYPFLYYDELHLRAQTSPLLLGFNRVSVMGEFFIPKIGRVRIVNVHFTNWAFEHHIRDKQLAETLKWIDQRQSKVQAAITFFGGDFNAKHNWGEMKQLAPGATVMDFQDYNGVDPTQGSPGSPHKRIDYIFVSAANRLLFGGEQILFKDSLKDGDSSFHLSDHCAVLHRYTLKTPTGPTEVSQAPQSVPIPVLQR
ncbi:MAG TPA: endonuclease/exonuclease/phosphatase family protein [Tepidisphaeraceae bacterium]|nr:endonuclease/exonuclease/phosphatase family protein [Tepidisphaeraceae bacterium]